MLVAMEHRRGGSRAPGSSLGVVLGGPAPRAGRPSGAGPSLRPHRDATQPAPGGAAAGRSRRASSAPAGHARRAASAGVEGWADACAPAAPADRGRTAAAPPGAGRRASPLAALAGRRPSLLVAAARGGRRRHAGPCRRTRPRTVGRRRTGDRARAGPGRGRGAADLRGRRPGAAGRRASPPPIPSVRLTADGDRSAGARAAAHLQLPDRRGTGRSGRRRLRPVADRVRRPRRPRARR